MMSDGYPIWLQNFIDIYTKLNINNTERILAIYAQNVVFIDPAHKLTGLSALQHYFDNLYTNVEACQFKIDNVFFNDDQAAVYWTMTYTHQRLNRANPITISGHSHLRGKDGLVVYHQDYLDLGAMVYEHIPLLGRFIRMIKARMTQ